MFIFIFFNVPFQIQTSVVSFALCTIISCLSTSCQIFGHLLIRCSSFHVVDFKSCLKTFQVSIMGLEIVSGKPKGHAIWVHKQV